jgi:mannose-6-phosphate isomerase-like protein (cupin superfamily)
MTADLFTAEALRALAAQSPDAGLFRASSGRYWTNLVTKDHAPDAKSELHDTEADVYVVLAGEADLHLGGTLIDATSPRPGQHRGTGLVGAECRRVRVGDVVVIPEGVAHMMDARADHITYLVVKVETA